MTPPEVFKPITEVETKPKAFSLIDMFQHYHHWRKKGDKKTADTKAFWLAVNNLESLNQEGSGRFETIDVLTEAYKTADNQVLLRNHQYANGDDMIAYHLDSLSRLSQADQGWSPLKVIRRLKNHTRNQTYAHEVKQTISVFSQLTAALNELDLSKPETTCHQLEVLGFSPVTTVVTRGFAATFPQLEEVIDQKIDVMMGPPIVSVSPPSRFHRQGQTSFGWLSRLTYIPHLHSFAVLQNGRFTAYSKKEIVEFLTFHNPDADNVRRLSSMEMLQYLHVLPPEFSAKHSHTILEEIIEHIGYAKYVPPVDDQVHIGDFNPTVLAKPITKIFDFEFTLYEENPELRSTIGERFAFWEDVLLHNAVGNFKDVNWESVVSVYIETFSNKVKAQSPRQHYSEIMASLLQAYPSFSVKLNLSLIDCVAGSVMNPSFVKNLQQLRMLPTRTPKRLEEWRQRKIRNRQELKQYCQEFGLDEKSFHRNSWFMPKDCRRCNTPEHYLGPCTVCPFCEVDFDFEAEGLVPHRDRPVWSSKMQHTSRDVDPPFKKYASFLDVVNNNVYLFSPSQ